MNVRVREREQPQDLIKRHLISVPVWSGYEYTFFKESNFPNDPPFLYNWSITKTDTHSNTNAYNAPEISRMVDEWSTAAKAGEKRGRAFRQKNVTHESFRGNYFSTTFGDMSYAVPPSFAEGSKAFMYPNRVVVDQAKLALQYHELFPATPEIVEDLFRRPTLPRSIKISKNPFETDFSIWYIVGDIYDFRSLFLKLGKRMLGIRPTLQEAFKIKAIPKTITAKDLHNSHLAYQFGLIPTIADVQDLIRQIITWRDKYDDNKDVLEKVRRVRIPRIALHDVLPDWKEVVSFNFPGSSIPVKCLISSSTKSVWSGHGYYHFRCPELTGFVARLKQLVDSFGILDYAALWDRVPFSFVVDWFFTTASVMHKLKPTLFPAEIVMDDYIESIRVETSVGFHLIAPQWRSFQAGTPAGPGTNAPLSYWLSELTSVQYPIGFETYTTYLRRRFKPDPSYVEISTDDLVPNLKTRRNAAVDLRRVSIAASLIGQRMPR